MDNSHHGFGSIWSITKLLRHDFRPSEYGRIVLPLTILRRLDCLLISSKNDVLAKATTLPVKADEQMRHRLLCESADYPFYNTSPFVFQPPHTVARSMSFQSILSFPGELAANVGHYMDGFSSNIKEDVLVGDFRLSYWLDRLNHTGLLELVFQRFAEIDLHLHAVNNRDMRFIIEKLNWWYAGHLSESARDPAILSNSTRHLLNLMLDDDLDTSTSVASSLVEGDADRPSDVNLADVTNLVDYLNDRFGYEFGPEVQLMFVQVCQTLYNDDELITQWRENPDVDLDRVFPPLAAAELMNQLQRAHPIADAFYRDIEFRNVVFEWMKIRVYRQLQMTAG